MSQVRRAGEVGYGENVPNATVQIRGQTSSRNAQKNYKIELKKNKGTWRGQRTINLNKHQTEGMRFRNKLSYDLLKGIPQLMSLRTQFVHLYVKRSYRGGQLRIPGLWIVHTGGTAEQDRNEEPWNGFERTVVQNQFV